MNKLSIFTAALCFMTVVSLHSVDAQSRRPTSRSTTATKTTTTSAPQSSAPSYDESAATLEETLSWLKGTFEAKAGHSHPLSGNMASWRQYVLYPAVAFKGCELSITERSYNESSSGEIRADDTFTKTFNLAALDPLSLVATNPYEDLYRLKLSTTNNLKKIFIKVEKSARAVDYWTNESELYFHDKDTIDRAQRAFKHAVKLCGGKVSPF